MYEIGQTASVYGSAVATFVDTTATTELGFQQTAVDYASLIM